jgi:hypothetical protein
VGFPIDWQQYGPAIMTVNSVPFMDNVAGDPTLAGYVSGRCVMTLWTVAVYDILATGYSSALGADSCLASPIKLPSSAAPASSELRPQPSAAAPFVLPAGPPGRSSASPPPRGKESARAG